VAPCAELPTVPWSPVPVLLAVGHGGSGYPLALRSPMNPGAGGTPVPEEPRCRMSLTSPVSPTESACLVPFAGQAMHAIRAGALTSKGIDSLAGAWAERVLVGRGLPRLLGLS
jgi:hypothetical protein